MRKLKSVWLWPWLPYVSLMISLALIGWTHFDKVQREQVRQRQKIELNSITAESDKIGRDLDQYKREYGALFAQKKLLTKEEKARVKVADEKLKVLSARIKEIQRRTRNARDAEKLRTIASFNSA